MGIDIDVLLRSALTPRRLLMYFGVELIEFVAAEVGRGPPEVGGRSAVVTVTTSSLTILL